MRFSTFRKDGKARKKKKSAVRKPKIRWSVLGLAVPEETPVSMEAIRRQVSLLARHGLGGGTQPIPAPDKPARGRNQLSGMNRTNRRGATESLPVR